MKKNTLQKVLALALAGVMAMGTLTACGNNDTPAAVDSSAPSDSSEASVSNVEPTVEEPTAVAGIEGYEAFDSNVTLRIPVYDRGDQSLQPVNDNYWTKYLQENFGDQYNITMEFVPIQRWEQMTDYALLAAGGILPTFLMEYDYWRMATWVSDGYMTPIDMDEFAFVAPDYYNRMVELGTLHYSVMQGDNYFVLAERPFSNTNYKFMNFVRMDWLREVGYDYVPVEYEDEMEALGKIQEAGISAYPLGGAMITGTGSDQNYGLRTFPMNEEEWAQYSSLGIYSLSWDPAKKFLQRENYKYNEGYLNPEYYVTSEDDQRANFINGDVYMYGGYMASTVDWLLAFYENNPDAELAVKPVKTTDTADDTAIYRTDNPFGMIIGFSSQATEDQIKAAWMYFEWMSQEDNLFPFAWGVEGETYNMVDGMPVAVGDYAGEYKQGFNGNKDYFCVSVEARVVGMGSVEEVIKANAPQGLPQDFSDDMIKVYYDQVALSEKGYGIFDPLYAEVIEVESEYQASLADLYISYRDQLVRCTPDQFDALYEDLSQKYWDAGFGEIVEARLALYQAGKTSVLADESK